MRSLRGGREIRVVRNNRDARLSIGWSIYLSTAKRFSPTTVSGVSGPAEQAAGVSAQRAFLDQYCATCHNERLLERGTVPVAFEDLDTENVGVHADVWEAVVRKLRLGMMPPVGRPRPDRETYGTFPRLA